MQPMVSTRSWAKSPVAPKVLVHAVRMEIGLWLFVEVGGKVMDKRD